MKGKGRSSENSRYHKSDNHTNVDVVESQNDLNTSSVTKYSFRSSVQSIHASGQNNTLQERWSSSGNNNGFSISGIFKPVNKITSRISKVVSMSSMFFQCGPSTDQTAPKRRPTIHKNDTGSEYYTRQSEKQSQESSTLEELTNSPERKKRRIESYPNSQPILDTTNSSLEYNSESTQQNNNQLNNSSHNDPNIELNNLECKIYSILPTSSRTIDTELLIASLIYHNRDVIPLLVKHPNIDPFVVSNDGDGNTILHNLVSNPGYEKEVAIFIDSVISHHDTYNRLTSMSSLPGDILREISEYTGSFFNIENKNGNTPLDICQNLELKTILKRSGAMYSENELARRIKKVFRHKGIPYYERNNITITSRLISDTLEEGDIDAAWLFMCHHSYKEDENNQSGFIKKDKKDRVKLSLYEEVEIFVYDNLPAHQIAPPGLNVRCYCEREDCPRSKFERGFWLDRSIIIDLSLKKDGKYVSFSDLHYERLTCPECKSLIKYHGVGFRQCKAKGCLQRYIDRSRPPFIENLINEEKLFSTDDCVICFDTESGIYNTRFFKVLS